MQMLVYEFMPNGTLRDNLSGTPYIHSLSLCFIDLTVVFFHRVRMQVKIEI